MGPPANHSSDDPTGSSLVSNWEDRPDGIHLSQPIQVQTGLRKTPGNRGETGGLTVPLSDEQPTDRWPGAQYRV